MQPLAIAAITIGVIMLVGVTVTLILVRRRATPGPVGFNPWQRHGSLPLVAAGLALGIITRTGSGQTSGSIPAGLGANTNKAPTLRRGVRWL
jgi:hypothetical protein